MGTYEANKNKLNNVAHRIANVLAGGVVAATFAGLWGFIAGIAPRSDVLPAPTSRSAVAAICFIAAGGSVLLLNRRPHNHRYATAGKVLASAVCGLGLVNIMLYQLGAPAVLAINTSIVFILVGAGIMLIDTRFEWLTQWLAPAVITIALVALIGHVYGVQVPTLSDYTANPVALDMATALLFLAISVAYFVMRPKRDGMDILFDPGAAGYMLRRLQVGAVAAAFVLGWLQIQSQTHDWYSPQVGITSLVITIIVLFSSIAWVSALYVRRADQQRRQAEARVRQERRLFKVVLDNLPVGVALVKLPSGKADLTNPAAVSILGYDPAQAPEGLGYKTLYKTNGAPYPYDELPLIESLRTGRATTKNDLVLHRDNGTQLPLRVTSAPFNALDSKEQTGLLIIEDYSKGLELERMKDEFLALATHQLQTPLTGIRGTLALLRDEMAGPLNPEQKELVKDAYDANERERSIVTDLLNVGRLESGRMVLEKRETDLTSMVHMVLKEQQSTITARKQTVRLQLPPETVYNAIDPARLRMCIENLVSNASKYTDDGGVITITMGQDAASTWISVQDSGVGITQKDIPSLFKRFTRIDNKLSQKVGGTGLGLYLVRQIVELHRGKVQVTSKPGEGTTFTITLPAEHMAR